MIVLALIAGGWLAGFGLNWLADSLPPDETGLTPPLRRPHCADCGHALPLWQWSALARLIALGSRCEACGAAQTWRPLAVELGAAGAAVGVWWWAGGAWGQWWPAALFISLAILVAVIDLEHLLILRVVMLPAALVLGGISALSPDRGWSSTLLGGLAGYGMVYAIYLAGQVFAALRRRGRQAGDEDETPFGGGDVNLAGVLGLALGWPRIWPALVLGIFAGGVIASTYALVQWARRRPIAGELPYGPSLLLGALLVYFSVGFRL
jgi:prepilin signal peptidase PulO-like enzyme (type II secretory pathway)